MGGGWQGGGWQGGGWQGGGWQGGGGGGVPTFAMRADKPFADFKIPETKLNTSATYPDFPKRYWDPDLFALTILPEFFGLPDPGGGGGLAWRTITVPSDAFPQADMVADIQKMLILAVTERPEALGEIIQQDQNLQLSWLQLLMMDESTHPCTFLLMKLAARVGETLMMYYKRQHYRPRPSQVCPTLFPPVAVPGHGSYPAGHALIGQLTSLCLNEVVPNRDLALFELARRAAFNRVIAGLHYPSDCDAGVFIANQIPAILNLCPTYKLVKDELALRKEWYDQ